MTTDGECGGDDDEEATRGHGDDGRGGGNDRHDDHDVDRGWSHVGPWPVLDTLSRFIDADPTAKSASHESCDANIDVGEPTKTRKSNKSDSCVYTHACMQTVWRITLACSVCVHVYRLV